MIHKEIEVYMDDMIAKSKNEEDHVQVLRKLFDRLRKYQLKLNPAKMLIWGEVWRVARICDKQ
jgi:Iap family predicted aminopeptidase